MVERRSVCVIGSDGVVGEALVRELEGRGVSVRRVAREDAWRHVRERLDGVELVCVDTSIWWDELEDEAVALAEFRGWMARAHEAGVAQVLVVTSAATLGVAGEQGAVSELGLYRVGDGELWEDRVWRLEGEAYGWMARGVRA